MLQDRPIAANLSRLSRALILSEEAGQEARSAHGQGISPTQVTQSKGLEGSEGLQSTGAVSSMLEELQSASLELSRARGALEDALLESAVAAAAPDSSLSTGKALQ